VTSHRTPWHHPTGDDPLKVARELPQVIDEWEQIFEAGKRPLPPVRVKPTMEFA
jgi:hypothetical protein